MKKSKILAAVVAAAVLSVSGGVLAGCNNEHKHTYSDDWTKDETGHWHVATCDDLKEGDKDYKSGFAAHVWGDDDECDVCHYTRTPPAPASKVTLNETELKLGIGNLEAELSATVEGGGTVTWASDNPTVVAVNEETGYVEAFKPGAATITATMVGGAAADKATCEVVVEDGYYLIGGQDSAWNKVGVFGQSGVVYFMPTDTAGIYKTESTELPRLGNFQVALVGDTSGDWYKKAFNGDYIATGDTVLSKNDGGNIAVEKHGKYTITLDLTGDKAVVSGVCDQVIDDGDVQEIYYLFGSFNGWKVANTLDDVDSQYVFTNNQDGTGSLTVELAKGAEFKILAVGMQYNIELGESAIPRDLIGDNGTATIDTDYKLTWTSSTNIGVGLSGKYTFTLNPEGETHNKLSYTFEATDDTETVVEDTVLHYYIKGTAVTDGGWGAPADEAHELKETGEGTGIYTMTITLAAGDFMFYSKEVGVTTGTVTDGKSFIKGSNLEAGVTCVTGSDNMTATEAGTYTFTYNASTQKLNVTFSATTPDA